MIYFSDFSASAGWQGTPGYIDRGDYLAVTGASAFTVDLPTDMEVGDILIANLLGFEGLTPNPVLGTTTGWTPILDRQVGDATAYRHFVLWHRVDGTEGSSVTFTKAGGTLTNGSDTIGGAISSFRGCVSTGTPYEDADGANARNSAPTAPSVTTTGDSRLIVNCWVRDDDVVQTAGSGFAREYDLFNAGENRAITLSTKEQLTAATVTGEAASLPSSERWSGISFALIPENP